MSETSKELVAFSIEYAVTGRAEEFTQKFGADLVESHALEEIRFSDGADLSVLHKHGGGSIPYKVGSWTLDYERIGSLISVGVYKKHR